MSHVVVVDAPQRPVRPTHPAQARRRRTTGKAAVVRRSPFPRIRKRAVPEAQPELARLKIDPGSRTTGLGVVPDHRGAVVWAAPRRHRGQQLRDRLLTRRARHRRRRQRQTRSRPPRCATRRRAGWLPPALPSRIQHSERGGSRRRRRGPVAALSQELVRCATPLLPNAEIAGGEDQPGELAGDAVREELLEKWGRTCAYGAGEHVALEVEPLVPRTRGGST